MLQTLITAHSGCEDTADNSLAYVRRALELKLDFLEVDIHPGSTGLYISHDSVPENMQGSQPTLREAFDILRGSAGNVGINCDLKCPDIERAVWDLAVACGVSERLVYSGSVSLENMRAHPPMAACVRVFWNISMILPENIYDTLRKEQRLLTQQELDFVVDTFADSGAECLNVAHEICDETFWKQMDAHGIRVSVWTVNDEERILQMLSRHALNITTRKPVLALECRQRLASSATGS